MNDGPGVYVAHRTGLEAACYLPSKHLARGFANLADQLADAVPRTFITVVKEITRLGA
jgi:hypothetical protein